MLVNNELEKNQKELDKLIKNTVREIKSRRVAWLLHLERMEEHWLSTRVTEWKPIAFRPRRRPKMKWEKVWKEVVVAYSPG